MIRNSVRTIMSSWPELVMTCDYRDQCDWVEAVEGTHHIDPTSLRVVERKERGEWQREKSYVSLTYLALAVSSCMRFPIVGLNMTCNERQESGDLRQKRSTSARLYILFLHLEVFDHISTNTFFLEIAYRPTDMADALCGPSNPLQNLQKQTSVDRTLQQERLALRRGQVEVFPIILF